MALPAPCGRLQGVPGWRGATTSRLGKTAPTDAERILAGPQPVWDALGVTSSGQPIFVEAKAHIAEAASPGSQASPESLKLIKTSLEEARKFYAPKASAGWAGTFYQYANRLAHHYLMRKVNGIDSHLVFLYFLNAADVGGPASREKWEGAIELLHAALGLTRLRAEGVYDVFVDVHELS